MLKEYFVHGVSGKNDDLAYVVSARCKAMAVRKVAELTGQAMVKFGKWWFLSDQGTTPDDIRDELESNFGSPRRSWELRITPFERDKNLME